MRSTESLFALGNRDRCKQRKPNSLLSTTEVVFQKRNLVGAVNTAAPLRRAKGPILGYTELMADGAYGEPSEKMFGILKRLEANGRHLLALINDVLDLSKIEAGQLVLDLSDYCVQDIAQTVRSTLEPLAADKKLAFKVEMAPELPPGCGDGRRLTQVLINLVGNAIKFTDAGELAIKAEASNGLFHVSVCDTGPREWRAGARGNRKAAARSHSYGYSTADHGWLRSDTPDQGRRFHALNPDHCSHVLCA
jgi:K+-sensing histidine kinase KdpD